MPTKKPLLHIKAKSGLKKQIKLKRKYLLSEFFKTAYYQIDKQKQHRRRGKHGVHHAYAYFMAEKVKFQSARPLVNSAGSISPNLSNAPLIKEFRNSAAE